MTGQLRPAGFFVVRTPLLPLSTLTRWSDGLASASAGEAQLDAAVAADRALLRQRLGELLAQPEVHAALATASESLLEAIPVWRQKPESEDGQKAERALVRYIARMACRATPFALMAGISVGEIGPRTSLRLAARSAYRHHTRLEAAHVHALADTIAADPAVGQSLRYRVRPGLYRLQREVRFYQRIDRGEMRTWVQRRISSTPAVEAVLERATAGATRDELVLAARAADPGLDAAAAVGVVERVIGALVHELEPPVTGPEPLGWLVDRVRAMPAASQHLAQLERLHDACRRSDHASLAGAPLQIDLVKPAEEATLRSNITSEIASAVSALARLASRGADPLAKLREAYARRYDDLDNPRFVPLLDLLDPDGGVGLDGPQGPHKGWLPDVGLPQDASPAATWGKRETFLFDKLVGAVRAGSKEIRLDRAELDALAPAATVPDSLSVIAAIAARPDTPDDFRVLVHHARVNATRLLARFAHVPELRPFVDKLVAAETELHAGSSIAEIVHFPIGPLGLMGALHHRPVLRELEIPLLVSSGAPPENQVPPDDLLVWVGVGRTVLWSKRLGRPIVPRIASAHRAEYRKGHVPAYRFLSALANEGNGPPYLEWSWAPLSAPFFPRVTLGRTVLALAEWRLDARDVKSLDLATPAKRFAAVQRLRERLAIPRFVTMLDVDNPSFDNVLFVDLEHSLSVDSFVHGATTAGRALLREPFASPDELLVQGPEGLYAHEIVIPYVRDASEQRSVPTPTPPAPSRTFVPGSEWLTLRVDAGMGTFDRLLLDELLPIVRGALASGEADRWFFLRLGLPVPQLRVRLHGDPARLSGARTRLEARLAELVRRGDVFRFEWTTYEREIERYGGPEAIEMAEGIFEADSDAVVEVLGLMDDPADELHRSRLTLVGVDRLLASLGLDTQAKLTAIQALQVRWRTEFSVDKQLDIRLGTTFRRERALLESWLFGCPGELAAFEQVYQRRSERILPFVRALTAIGVPLERVALSYVHMHCIRMAVRHSRMHELVIYDFLGRLYESVLARARKAT